ncbi:hypothetical protein V8C43DRAFT_284275 [Trichoderma afarasin]
MFQENKKCFRTRCKKYSVGSAAMPLAGSTARRQPELWILCGATCWVSGGFRALCWRSGAEFLLQPE